VVKNADNNHAPRQEIILQQVIPTSWTGYVALRKDSSGGDMRVFDSPTGGTEITFNEIDNIFASNELPKHLYVEGYSDSAHMRDAVLTLSTVEGYDTPDSVKFTVLWVQPVDVAFSGTASNDNDKIDVYRAWTEADTYDLGLQKFDDPDDWWGWGTQARGIVHPNEFEYPLVAVRLDRDWEVRRFDGAGNAIGEPKDFSAEIPPGNDTSPPVVRDDDPTDSDPFGAIYDLDAPGTYRVDAPANEIRRMRANFKAFATAPLREDDVRASFVTSYFVRISIKQVDAPTGMNWILVNDVPGDNQAGYGTTPLTWNLQ